MKHKPVWRAVLPSTMLSILVVMGTTAGVGITIGGCGSGGAAKGGSQPTASPSPVFSPTPSISPTASPIPTPAASPTAAPSPASSPSPVPTADPTPSPSPVPTPTPAPTPTPEPTPSPTPVPTPVPTPTPTPVPVVVTVKPGSVTLSIGDSTTFSARVTGTTNTDVTWAVQETNGGSIDSHGTYTAPAARGTYHVVAVSVADGSAKGTATVVVQSGGIGGTIN